MERSGNASGNLVAKSQMNFSPGDPLYPWRCAEMEWRSQVMAGEAHMQIAHVEQYFCTSVYIEGQ